MTPFELLEPTTMADAIALLDPDDPTTRPCAGGTALMLMMKAGVFQPTRLISLGKIEKRFCRIADDADGDLCIGAMTTLSAVEHSAVVARRAPVIVRTMQRLSNVRVRNVATIGGGLAHADPHMDLPPVLIALGAHVEVAGPDGVRTIAVENLFAGYFETVLRRDELITALMVPGQAARRAAYLKCTTRAVHDWPALGVAVSVDPVEAAPARIVISAATEKPLRLAGAEAVLRGGIDEAALRRAGDAAADEAQTISDGQGSAAYKRALVRVYVRRALAAALDGAR